MILSPKQMVLFEQKVQNTIEQYQLCNKNDKVLVACSGGKDSTTTLYLLHKLGYNVEGLIIDLMIGDWSKRNLDNVKSFCAQQKIKLHIVDLRTEFGCSMCFLKSGIQSKTKLNNCLICGVIKRWLLNKKARELGASKIATGHNLDDGAETVLMNLLKGKLSLNLGMGPQTGVIKDTKFVPRIKPLYFCLNEEVKQYSLTKKFPVVYDPCPCSVEGFRKKIRLNLKKLESDNSQIKLNIVNTFLGLQDTLKKRFSVTENMVYCQFCGEPSRKETCKMCGLIKIIK